MNEKLLKWMPVVVTVIVNLILLAFWFGTVINQLGSIKQELQTHETDQTRHLSYETAVKTFVTRPEYETEAARLVRIEAKIDRLYEILIQDEKR